MTLPVLEATVCFLRKERKTALVDYTNYPHPLHAGLFAPPGGRLEKGETKETSVKREIWEEQNIRINSLIYRGSVFFNNEKRHFGGKPAKYSFKVFYFDSHDFDDSQAKSREGKLVWVADDFVLELPMHEGDKAIWKWLDRHRLFDAEILHEGEKLVRAALLGIGA